MIIAKQNPQGSYIYNINVDVEYSTPMGSHLVDWYVLYKYSNPTDCYFGNKFKEVVK